MESHEAMPLQEVMSSTQGPASGIRNAGMTSGPSTTTAVQVPSSLMPHGRTTVDEAAGQVGSLGTTGATYGSVATVEIVDALGVITWFRNFWSRGFRLDHRTNRNDGSWSYGYSRRFRVQPTRSNSWR